MQRVYDHTTASSLVKDQVLLLSKLLLLPVVLLHWEVLLWLAFLTSTDLDGIGTDQLGNL